MLRPPEPPSLSRRQHRRPLAATSCHRATTPGSMNRDRRPVLPDPACRAVPSAAPPLPCAAMPMVPPSLSTPAWPRSLPRWARHRSPPHRVHAAVRRPVHCAKWCPDRRFRWQNRPVRKEGSRNQSEQCGALEHREQANRPYQCSLYVPILLEPSTLTDICIQPVHLRLKHMARPGHD